jgi:hypothetical protein
MIIAPCSAWPRASISASRVPSVVDNPTEVARLSCRRRVRRHVPPELRLSCTNREVVKPSARCRCRTCRVCSRCVPCRVSLCCAVRRPWRVVRSPALQDKPETRLVNTP